MSQFGKFPSPHISSALAREMQRSKAEMQKMQLQKVPLSDPWQYSPLSLPSLEAGIKLIYPALLGKTELLAQMQETVTLPGCCSVGLSPWRDQIAHFDSQFGFIFCQSLSLRAHLRDRESLTAYFFPCLLLGGTNPA